MDKRRRKQLFTIVSDAGAQAILPSISRKKQLEREQRLKCELEKPFNPVLRFAVCSDIHLNADAPQIDERFEKLFDTAYEYSSKCECHPTLDALVVVGDFTDGGRQEQYDIYNDIVKRKRKDETEVITVMGNHEYIDLGLEGYLKNIEGGAEQHRLIGGFHFISMAPKPTDTWHTPSQALWMLGQLIKAKKDDKKKPIFTFQHGHILKTVYVSRSWYTQLSWLLHPVYSLFPQVINFSGHSHGPVNNPLEVWQSRYTLFATGTLRYFEMERDLGDNTVPENADRAAQYLIVEVDEGNRVRVRPFNLLTGAFFKTEEGKELTFLVEDPSDRGTYPYTAARKKTFPAPFFDTSAAAETEEAIEENALRLTFPQAKSRGSIYAYRIRVSSASSGDILAVKEVYSGYYFEPMPDKVSVIIPGFEKLEGKRIEIIPLNIFKKHGTSLRLSF